MPYKHPELQPLTSEKCDLCKFCIWDEERREYGCEVKGCYEHSKFVEYEMKTSFELEKAGEISDEL